jgi:hypothetical protein
VRFDEKDAMIAFMAAVALMIFMGIFAACMFG